MDTETGEMIVKRVSVPIGLEELMEGLVKEVLLKKPNDIYLFAARYFANLLTVRDKSKIPHCKAKNLRSVQTLKEKPEKLSSFRTSKLSKQLSIREDPVETPIVSHKPKMYHRNELKYKRRHTGPSTTLENNQKLDIRRKYARSVSTEKHSVESNNNKHTTDVKKKKSEEGLKNNCKNKSSLSSSNRLNNSANSNNTPSTKMLDIAEMKQNDKDAVAESQEHKLNEEEDNTTEDLKIIESLEDNLKSLSPEDSAKSNISKKDVNCAIIEEDVIVPSKTSSTLSENLNISITNDETNTTNNTDKKVTLETKSDTEISEVITPKEDSEKKLKSSKTLNDDEISKILISSISNDLSNSTTGLNFESKDVAYDTKENTILNDTLEENIEQIITGDTQTTENTMENNAIIEPHIITDISNKCSKIYLGNDTLDAISNDSLELNEDDEKVIIKDNTIEVSDNISETLNTANHNNILVVKDHNIKESNEVTENKQLKDDDDTIEKSSKQDVLTEKSDVLKHVITEEHNIKNAKIEDNSKGIKDQNEMNSLSEKNNLPVIMDIMEHTDKTLTEIQNNEETENDIKIEKVKSTTGKIPERNVLPENSKILNFNLPDEQNINKSEQESEPSELIEDTKDLNNFLENNNSPVTLDSTTHTDNMINEKTGDEEEGIKVKGVEDSIDESNLTEKPYLAEEKNNIKLDQEDKNSKLIADKKENNHLPVTLDIPNTNKSITQIQNNEETGNKENGNKIKKFKNKTAEIPEQNVLPENSEILNFNIPEEQDNKKPKQQKSELSKLLENEKRFINFSENNNLPTTLDSTTHNDNTLIEFQNRISEQIVLPDIQNIEIANDEKMDTKIKGVEDITVEKSVLPDKSKIINTNIAEEQIKNLKQDQKENNFQQKNSLPVILDSIEYIDETITKDEKKDIKNIEVEKTSTDITEQIVLSEQSKIINNDVADDKNNKKSKVEDESSKLIEDKKELNNFLDKNNLPEIPNTIKYTDQTIPETRTDKKIELKEESIKTNEFEMKINNFTKKNISDETLSDTDVNDKIIKKQINKNLEEKTMQTFEEDTNVETNILKNEEKSELNLEDSMQPHISQLLLDKQLIKNLVNIDSSNFSMIDETVEDKYSDVSPNDSAAENISVNDLKTDFDVTSIETDGLGITFEEYLEMKINEGSNSDSIDSKTNTNLKPLIPTQTAETKATINGTRESNSSDNLLFQKEEETKSDNTNEVNNQQNRYDIQKLSSFEVNVTSPTASNSNKDINNISNNVIIEANNKSTDATETAKQQQEIQKLEFKIDLKHGSGKEDDLFSEEHISSENNSAREDPLVVEESINSVSLDKKIIKNTSRTDNNNIIDENSTNMLLNLQESVSKMNPEIQEKNIHSDTNQEVTSLKTKSNIRDDDEQETHIDQAEWKIDNKIFKNNNTEKMSTELIKEQATNIDLKQDKNGSEIETSEIIELDFNVKENKSENNEEAEKNILEELKVSKTSTLIDSDTLNNINNNEKPTKITEDTLDTNKNETDCCLVTAEEVALDAAIKDEMGNEDINTNVSPVKTKREIPHNEVIFNDTQNKIDLNDMDIHSQDNNKKNSVNFDIITKKTTVKNNKIPISQINEEREKNPTKKDESKDINEITDISKQNCDNLDINIENNKNNVSETKSNKNSKDKTNKEINVEDNLVNRVAKNYVNYIIDNDRLLLVDNNNSTGNEEEEMNINKTDIICEEITSDDLKSNNDNQTVKTENKDLVVENKNIIIKEKTSSEETINDNESVVKENENEYIKSSLEAAPISQNNVGNNNKEVKTPMSGVEDSTISDKITEIMKTNNKQKCDNPEQEKIINNDYNVIKKINGIKKSVSFDKNKLQEEIKQVKEKSTKTNTDHKDIETNAENEEINNNTKNVKTMSEQSLNYSPYSTRNCIRDEHDKEIDKQKATDLIHLTLSVAKSGLIEHKVKKYINEFISNEQNNVEKPSEKEIKENIAKNLNKNQNLLKIQPSKDLKSSNSFDSSKLREELKIIEEESKFTNFNNYNPFVLHKEIEEISKIQTSNNLNFGDNASSQKVLGAVLKIQALWRGFKARKYTTAAIGGKNKKETDHSSDDRADIKEETTTKENSHQSKDYSDEKELTSTGQVEYPLSTITAAITIQKIWRGFKGKKKLLKRSKNEDAKESNLIISLTTQEDSAKTPITLSERSIEKDNGCITNIKEDNDLNNKTIKKFFNRDSSDSIKTVIHNEGLSKSTKSSAKYFHTDDVDILLDEILDYPTMKEEDLLDNYQSKLLDKISGKESDNDLNTLENIISPKHIEDINLEELKSNDFVYSPVLPKSGKIEAKDKKLTRSLSLKLEILEEETSTIEEINEETDNKPAQENILTQTDSVTTIARQLDSQDTDVEHLIDNKTETSGMKQTAIESVLKLDKTIDVSVMTNNEPIEISSTSARKVESTANTKLLSSILDNNNEEKNNKGLQINPNFNNKLKSNILLDSNTKESTKESFTGGLNSDLNEIGDEQPNTSKPPNTIDTQSNKNESKIDEKNEGKSEKNDEKLYTFCSVPIPIPGDVKFDDKLIPADAEVLQVSTSQKKLIERNNSEENAMTRNVGVNETFIIPLPIEVQKTLKVEEIGKIENEEEQEKCASLENVSSILSKAGMNAGELHETVILPINPHQSAGRSQPIAVQLCQTSDAENVTSQCPPSSSDVTDAFNTDAADAGVEERYAQNPGKGYLQQRKAERSSSADISISQQESMESEKRRKIESNKNMEAEAATKIQAGFRGYQVRKQLKLKNGSSDKNTRKSSLKSKTTGPLDPKKQSQKSGELEEQSAVKIQAGVRGFLVRRRQKNHQNSQQA